MTNLIIDNLSLILLLPLWIFLIIMCGRFFSVYVNKGIIYILTLIASALGAGTCAATLFNIKAPLDWIYPFIKIQDFTIYFGLRIDKLSLIIAFVLFIVSFSVQLFSVSYMNKEKKSYKFFALLNLFNFAMAFLLFSPNLFQLYVFWELVSVISYLLIGFEYKSALKSIASKRVFIINRIGDTALITGIILTSYFMYTYAGNKSFAGLSFEDIYSISTLLLAYTSTPVLIAICGLFIIGAIVKSAQFPFYTWLQDAMTAKLPVSALLHSATMVIAGVFLIIKLLPLFSLNKFLMLTIVTIGLLTAIICGILACFETHPKKILAYSTSANLGLMFTAIGLGNIKAGLILLVVHAFIKSGLFIILPQKDEKMPVLNIILFGIGALSLSGILLSGLGAKEIIYSGLVNNPKISILYLLVSFITAYYISRLFLLIYKNCKFTNTINVTEFISFFILLVCNFTLYVILRQSYTIAEPFAAAIGGLCLALLLYKHNCLTKISYKYKLLEKFNNIIVPNLYKKFTHTLNKCEMYIFGNYKPAIYLSRTFVNISYWIEKNIMNKSVSLIADGMNFLSKKDMILQKGNVQTYNAYAFIIVTIVIVFIIIGYTVLLI